MTTGQPLKKYLVCYGAENDFWLCDADSRDHAVEQFESADRDGDVNDVFECVPALNRYYVRQRRAMWITYVQEVEAVDADDAIDAFHDTFNPPHAVVEGPVQRLDPGPAAAFDLRDYPYVDDVFAAD